MSNRKRQVYFTSDWHIGHSNVLQFSQRPFKDLEHMHEVLANNYNSVVPPNGTGYFLGDMGFGNGAVLRDIITSLNGKKILILGNHDRGAVSMERLGFDIVLHSASMLIANETVTMSHCPLRGVTREDVIGMHGHQEGENWHGEFRHQQFSVPDYGQFHVHGHIHSPNRGKSSTILGRQYDVGVDGNNYRPVSISQLESWIALTKQKGM